MKKLIILSIVLFASIFSATKAQERDKKTLAKGMNFIETRTYSVEDDAKILELYKNLRVADVSDGLDMVGLPGTGLVDPAIHADWVDLKDFTHIFRGIAVTVRYVPTQRLPLPASGEEFHKWEGNFYNSYSHEAFTQLIKPGTAVVIDDVEDKDIGSIGSNNILYWYKLGAVGIVTDAGSRDTDEVGLERVPLYLRKKGRGIRPGRNEIESVNRPVSIGGVLVCPGDVVVGDGDGVVVVPRAVAEQVAKYASEILIKDKTGRKGLYESLGRPLDKTVK
ncbi:MAG: RraA family protein [Bacteroidia bacterium]|nr:RraA family protein [Bacteroidia bacterium]